MVTVTPYQQWNNGTRSLFRKCILCGSQSIVRVPVPQRRTFQASFGRQPLHHVPWDRKYRRASREYCMTRCIWLRVSYPSQTGEIIPLDYRRTLAIFHLRLVFVCTSILGSVRTRRTEAKSNDYLLSLISLPNSNA
jgi:hypothetical protein